MKTVLAICAGASLGALGRWQLGLWLSPGGLLPWGTLAANWLGAYAIGFALPVLQISVQDPVWRLAIVTGVLGALTTFSTFSVENVELLQQGRLGLAAAHVGLHLLGSLLLTWLGVQTALWWLAQRG